MIIREDSGSVSILRFAHGKVHALDLEFCEIFSQKLAELEKSSQKAIVLTGTGTTFSAGVDLFRLLQEGENYTRRFLPKMLDLFQRIFLFPKPVIAAMNGNAIAGGCVIASACDYRIAIQGQGKISLSEVLVGVPFPALAFEIVRFAVDPRYLPEVVYFGHYYEMEEGLKRGLLDEVVSSQDLLSRACTIAEKLSEMPEDTFRLVKLQLRQPFLDTSERSRIRDEETMNVWCSEQTRTTIRAYLQRTLGK
jgi:enoyl-CoA hydratase